MQVVTQHHFQNTINQQQLQIRNPPQVQIQQIVGQHRIQRTGGLQHLQEVVVNPQQQQTGMPTSQQPQLQQVSVQQVPIQQQQHIRTACQGQQRIVQTSQAMAPQRMCRLPNVKNLEQRPQPLQGHAQYHLQSHQQQQLQHLQIQQPLSQGRPVQQFRQQSQTVHETYSPRFQHSRVHQNTVPSGNAPIVNEQRDGIVVKHQNSVQVAHHTQIRPLPPGNVM